MSFVFAIAVGFGGDIVVALTVARAAGRGGMGTRWRELILFAIGAAVVVIATSLPVIGGIVKLAVVLFGVGALALVAYAPGVHAPVGRCGRPQGSSTT